MTTPSRISETEGAHTANPEIVVFDFDGTITTKDTFALFLRYYAGPLGWARRIVALLPTFVRYKLGKIDRHAVKKAVVRAFFQGEPIEAVEASAKIFADTVIPKLTRPDAMMCLTNKLKGPNAAPESLYICSASIGPYLRHWASAQGINTNHVMATELDVVDGVCSGLLRGYNVWGENKVRRIFDQFAPQSVKILEAYGDTRGDREMLHAAEASFFRPFRVRPISR